MDGAMMAPLTVSPAISLRDVEVRLVRTQEERRCWDELVARHHYLPFHGLFGKAVRHIAVQGERWLALLGWTSGAFKVGPRDRWIGWSPDQQFQRLHLVANNARFVVFGEPVPNLASRVLSLSLRRLAGDMQTLHGYPVWLAESFVDPSRFAATCYRAANWQSLGFTRGFSRKSGGVARWRQNGQPKEIFMDALRDDAQAALCRDDVPGSGQLDAKAAIPKPEVLRSLHSFLAGMEDFRKPRGQRYSLACYFTLMIAARLCGYRGITAFGQFGALLDQEQLAAVGGFWSESRQCYTAPAESTFHYILSTMPPETLDNAVNAWVQSQSDGTEPVAIDGKNIRGASKQTEDGKHIMVAVLEHDSGLVLGQVAVSDKSNEIPAVRTLVQDLDLAGRTVTVDAMHVQQETAQCLVEDCGADYVVTAVKDNQPTLHEDLVDADWSDAKFFTEPVDKAHGRLEQRHCALLDITGPDWDGYCDLHGRKQAFRIKRYRLELKTGKESRETVYGLTSLGADVAGPKNVAMLVRNHWSIENRLHYPRDFSYDEDRCRAHVRNRPRNLATLSNVAISIVRLDTRFDFLPPAHRHFAARNQEAIDAVMT